MGRMALVLTGCAIAALGLSVFFRDSSGPETAVLEQTPSRVLSSTRIVTGTSGQQARRQRLAPRAARDPAMTEEQFKQLPRADQDKVVEAFVAAFWASESGASDDSTTPEPYISLDLFGRPYMHTLTESEFGQLSPEDREAAMAEIVESCRAIRSQMLDVIAQAQAGRANQDYARAEAYLISGLERGRGLSANKNGLFVTRVVGIACQKAALNGMVRLYTELGDDARVRTAQGHLQDLEAEMNEIREAARQSEG